MTKHTITVAASRENWRSLCQEPELTEDEQRERLQMQHQFRQQAGLFDYILACTEQEWNALPTVPEGGHTWEGLVEWADAYRRLQRAELAAWQEWKRTRNGS